jgi:hypothetical protein
LLALVSSALPVLLVAASCLLVASTLAVYLTAPILAATAALGLKTSRTSRRSPRSASPRRRKPASTRWTLSGKATPTPSSSTPSTATAPATTTGAHVLNLHRQEYDKDENSSQGGHFQ